jgi:hypothetical protein
MSVYSAFSSSSDNKAAYNYQAAVDRNNAMIANWNAQDAARRGEQDLIDTRRKTAAIMGNQRATLAGRGIDLSEGSALNILSDTAYLGEQDALTVKDNTAKNVWAAKVQANNDTANAGLLKMRADNENPLLSGASSLLTGAGKVADSWYKYAGTTTSASSPAFQSTDFWKGSK